MTDEQLHCPWCDQAHAMPALRPGERAFCVRCGTTMAERGRLGPAAPLAFAVTGLVLALAALRLPFVTLQKFGNVRTTLLTVGRDGFWSNGYEFLAVWVWFCGILAPIGLLGLLVALHASDRHDPMREWNHRLHRAAEFIEYWAMPEVQVLGVMVAFFKLGSVVDVAVGPGLWCYGAASIFMLLAWRRAELKPRPQARAHREVQP